MAHDAHSRWRFATWNVASINNNPFEHHASSGKESNDEDDVTAFIISCERFLCADTSTKPSASASGARTVIEASLCRNDRLDAIERALVHSCGRDAGRVARARAAFERDVTARDAAAFLLDAEIGSKRLCSMPDRVTNTIRAMDSVTKGEQTWMRPTVINCYGARMTSEDDWFRRWSEYMFDFTFVSIDGRERKVMDLMIPIKRAKYPAVSEEEEALGIDLQVFYLYAFDQALVTLATSAAGSFTGWQDVRAKLVDDLVTHKFSRTLDALEKIFLSSGDAVAPQTAACFLQEVGASLADALEARPHVKSRYDVLRPKDMDVKRDQNSIIVLSKAFTRGCEITEATSEILETLGDGVTKFSKGDFCAFLAHKVLFCSYHGDTDGLQTKTITGAVQDWCSANASVVDGCVFCMDANTHVFHREGKKQGARDFIDFVASSTTFASCWTLAGVDVERDAMTTFSARTFLQAQLNKAVKRDECASSELTDRHPKDHVLVALRDDTSATIASSVAIARVNAIDFTVDPPKALAFDPSAMFQNAQFPSDHACVLFDCALSFMHH